MEIYNFATSLCRKTNYEVIQSADKELVLDRCFACSVCNKCLAGEKAILKAEKMYCWLCFENFFGLKCVSCMKSISGLNKMSFVCYNNKVWHRECFCSFCCGQLLQDGQVMQDKQCVSCRQFYNK